MAAVVVSMHTYPPSVLNCNRRDFKPRRGKDFGPSTDTVCLTIHTTTISHNKNHHRTRQQQQQEQRNGVGRSPIVVSVSVDQYREPRYFLASTQRSSSQQLT